MQFYSKKLSKNETVLLSSFKHSYLGKIRYSKLVEESHEKLLQVINGSLKQLITLNTCD